MLAACSWPDTRDVRTADPSADGRRSAASRTAIGGGIIIVSPPLGRQLVDAAEHGLYVAAGRPSVSVCHRSIAATAAGGFAAECPVGRRYRLIAASTVHAGGAAGAGA